MIIDCHVHVSACTQGHGSMSPALIGSVPFRFMRWKFGLRGADATTERGLETKLVQTIDESPIDAAVVLAFDAVHDRDGHLDASHTHLYVTNDYVIELSRRHPKILFGASVHPYRRDAVAETERCIKAGAVLMKWLPLTQGISPADERCIPVYEVMSHYKLPLLSHTGGEQSLVKLDYSVRDPMLLETALKRGVTVIAAHCGSRSSPWEPDYVPQFIRLTEQYEHFYGDTAALNLPTRWYAMDIVLSHKIASQRLVHGSDWPIPSLPSPRRLGWGTAWELMNESNWMRRDALIKQKLGLDESYWHRAGKILRLSVPAQSASL